MSASKEYFANESYLDELFSKRIILIDKEITEELCGEWIGKIALLDLKGAKTKKPIILLVNTYGGDAYAAMGVMDVIKNCVCPVITVCIGVAMSGGSVILGSGTKRYAVPNSRIMVHQHWDDMGPKTHMEIMNEAEESKRLFKQLEDYYVVAMGQSHAKVKKLLEKDSYLTAQDALTLGLIDEIGWKIHDWLK